jgi:hypothetical protein
VSRQFTVIGCSNFFLTIGFLAGADIETKPGRFFLEFAYFRFLKKPSWLGKLFKIKSGRFRVLSFKMTVDY